MYIALLSTIALLLVQTPASARPSIVKRDLDVPEFALKYAPWVHLYSGEQWFPSDLNTHLISCTAFIDKDESSTQPAVLNIGNIDFDNVTDMFITSDDNVEDNPSWLLSDYGIPDGSGKSAAATIMVLVDKADTVGPGIVDVFYFMFYSYDHGGKVLGETFGNHVGDWENILIRFNSTTPESIFLSAHSGGAGYTYSAVEKKGDRPVFYVATGTHANYATVGSHAHDLPLGLLKDVTDKGALWDLAANHRAFWWSSANGFAPATGNDWPTNFLDYVGHWGDKQYSIFDSRQYCVLEECHYVDGPTGPRDKGLDRTNVCNSDDCDISTSV